MGPASSGLNPQISFCKDCNSFCKDCNSFCEDCNSFCWTCYSIRIVLIYYGSFRSQLDPQFTPSANRLKPNPRITGLHSSGSSIMKVMMMGMLLIMSFFLMSISRAWSLLEASMVKIDKIMITFSAHYPHIGMANHCLMGGRTKDPHPHQAGKWSSQNSANCYPTKFPSHNIIHNVFLFHFKMSRSFV